MLFELTNTENSNFTSEPVFSEKYFSLMKNLNSTLEKNNSHLTCTGASGKDYRAGAMVGMLL